MYDSHDLGDKNMHAWMRFGQLEVSSTQQATV